MTTTGGLLRRRAVSVPGLSTRAGAVQVNPSSELLRVANWPGLERWYSPATFESNVWHERMNGRRLGRAMVNTLSTGANPVVGTIGGKSFLVFNNASRMGATDGAAILPVAAGWTIALAWHGDSGSDNDYLWSEPHTLTADASNRYLRLLSAHSASTSFFTMNSQGGGGANIFASIGSSGNTYPRNAVTRIIISYSVALGYTWWFNNSTGSTTGSLASPVSAQLVTRGELQIGALAASTGTGSQMKGGIGDFYIFDVDLNGAAYSATLADVKSKLTADYP